MLDAVVLLLIAGATLGSLGFRAAYTRDRRIKRLLRRIKATPIRDVPDGRMIKIIGELVYADRSIPSPLSTRACAYYAILVEQYRDGPHGGHW